MVAMLGDDEYDVVLPSVDESRDGINDWHTRHALSSSTCARRCSAPSGAMPANSRWTSTRSST
eukprot:1970052-Prymnesium_polylepis.1